MKPPEEGRVNGSPHPAGVEVRASQRSRYPYVQHFGARAVFATLQSQHDKEPTGYELRIGLLIGPGTGKSIDIEIPRGAPGAFVAAMLREVSDAIARHVEDCAAAANEADEPIPAAIAKTLPAKGEPCPKCDSRDPARHATCAVPGCPCARARRGAEPILARGALASAVNDALQPAADPVDDGHAQETEPRKH